MIDPRRARRLGRRRARCSKSRSASPRLLGAEVEAVHVRDDGSGDGRGRGRRRGAACRCTCATATSSRSWRSAMHERDAIALVIGARGGPPGRDAGRSRRAGRRAVARGHDRGRSAGRDAIGRCAASSSRSRETARAPGSARLFDHLGDRPLPEVIALHVIEPSALPPFADSPVHEADAFEREFRIRVASGLLVGSRHAVRFEMRVGDAADVAARRAARARRRSRRAGVAPRSSGRPRSSRAGDARARIDPVALFALDDRNHRDGSSRQR